MTRWLVLKQVPKSDKVTVYTWATARVRTIHKVKGYHTWVEDERERGGKWILR